MANLREGDKYEVLEKIGTNHELNLFHSIAQLTCARAWIVWCHQKG